MTLKFSLAKKIQKYKIWSTKVNCASVALISGFRGELDARKLWILGLDPQGGVRNQLVLLVLGFWCSQAYIVSLLSISSSFSITLVVIASFFVICA